MRISATDPYEVAMERGGFTEAFLERQKERKKAEAQVRIAAGLLRQFEGIVASRGLPEWVVEIIVSVAASHGINPFPIVSRNSKRTYAAARHEAIYRIKAANRGLTTPRIAAFFCMDHTSILYALTKHAETHGLPKFSCYHIAYERRRQAAREMMKRAA